MFWHILQIAWHQTQKAWKQVFRNVLQLYTNTSGNGSISFPFTQIYSFQLERLKEESLPKLRLLLFIQIKLIVK